MVLPCSQELSLQGREGRQERGIRVLPCTSCTLHGGQFKAQIMALTSWQRPHFAKKHLQMAQRTAKPQNVKLSATRPHL